MSHPVVPRSRLARRAAVVVFAGHLALLLVIQLENYFGYVHRSGDGLSGACSFLLRLPFMQLQHVAVAAALAALAALAVRWRPAAVAFTGVLTSLNVYLAVDQVIYKLFFDHANLSQNEGVGVDLGAMRDSFVAELDRWFYVNLALIVVITVVTAAVMVGRWWPRRPEAATTSRPVRRGTGVLRVSVAAAWGVSCLVLAPRWQLHNLEDHAVITLAESALTRTYARAVDGWERVDTRRLRHGVAAEPESQREELGRARTALTALVRPNVVTIVLESVGSQNLIVDGRIDASLAPHLAALSSRGVLFDSLYTSFPSTTRSHMERVTGGYTLTWGSVHEEMGEYRGPTLVASAHAAGYRTALFSAQRLHFENMGALYRQLPYDKIYDPDHAGDPATSWGVDERLAWRRALAWIDGDASRGTPFLLDFFTISTHHPYDLPAGHVSPFTGDDRQQRYRATIHFTDQVIGQMVSDLEQRGLLANTVFVITGDHGEAFGDVHHGNLGHKNRLFEENVREFLLIAAPGSAVAPITTPRIGRTGDIFPTVARLLRFPPHRLPGRDLLDPGRATELVYFHKSSTPAEWGVRDGRWKYVARTDGHDERLYDLATDPGERRDLGASHPEMLTTYARLCSAWYFQANAAFVAVSGDTRQQRLRPDDLRTPGPKYAELGVPVKGHNTFRVVEPVRAGEPIFARIQWVEDGQEHTVVLRWIDPLGVAHDTPAVTLGTATSRSTHLAPNGRLRIPGRWRLEVLEAGRPRLTHEFVVGGAARARAQTRSRPRTVERAMDRTVTATF